LAVCAYPDVPAATIIRLIAPNGGVVLAAASGAYTPEPPFSVRSNLHNHIMWHILQLRYFGVCVTGQIDTWGRLLLICSL
jgi:hypothetical protein